MVRPHPEGLTDVGDYYDFVEGSVPRKINVEVAASTAEPNLEARMSIKDKLNSAWEGTKNFVKDNPALSGALAGGAAGSAIPVVGTVAGAVAGAVIGYNVGRDDDQKGSDKKETK